jgi:hypothetical protein
LPETLTRLFLLTVRPEKLGEHFPGDGVALHREKGEQGASLIRQLGKGHFTLENAERPHKPYRNKAAFRYGFNLWHNRSDRSRIGILD